MLDAKKILMDGAGLALRFWWLIALFIVVYIVAELLQNKRRPEYLYKRKDFVMTESERIFYRFLVDAVGDQYYIFPQVHLNALLEHKVRGQNWRGAFRHIDEKSVDFVLCYKSSLHTELAIELDDPSHERLNRIERDIEVEKMLRVANMPLLRIRRKGSYDKNELLQLIRESLGATPIVNG